MEVIVWSSAGGRKFNIKELIGDHCMVAGGGNINKRVSWKPLYGGAQGGSLNKKLKWRPSYGGAQGGKFK